MKIDLEPVWQHDISSICIHTLTIGRNAGAEFILSIDNAMDHQSRIRCFRTAVLLLTAACAQYTNLLMAHEASETSKRAKWSDAEIEAFLTYLQEHRSESGKGGFKASAFNGAATHIAPLLSQGGVPKTAKCCQTKWNSVCHFTTNDDTDSLFVDEGHIYCHRNISGHIWCPLGYCTWGKYPGRGS